LKNGGWSLSPGNYPWDIIRTPPKMNSAPSSLKVVKGSPKNNAEAKIIKIKEILDDGIAILSGSIFST
jgi:hypothetical protein